MLDYIKSSENEYWFLVWNDAKTRKPHQKGFSTRARAAEITNAKLENHYKDAPFSMPQLEVSVSIPTKTFLEKILLLNE